MFNGRQTAQILQALSFSPSIKTLVKVSLYRTVNFAERESSFFLAEFLAGAANLTELNIGEHTGREHQITLELPLEDSKETDTGLVHVAREEANPTITRECCVGRVNCSINQSYVEKW